MIPDLSAQTLNADEPVAADASSLRFRLPPASNRKLQGVQIRKQLVTVDADNSPVISLVNAMNLLGRFETDR